MDREVDKLVHIDKIMDLSMSLMFTSTYVP